MKKCPFCAEDIQDAAVVCKHCGRDLPKAPAPAPTPLRSAPVAPSLSVGVVQAPAKKAPAFLKKAGFGAVVLGFVLTFFQSTWGLGYAAMWFGLFVALWKPTFNGLLMAVLGGGALAGATVLQIPGGMLKDRREAAEAEALKAEQQRRIEAGAKELYGKLQKQIAAAQWREAAQSNEQLKRVNANYSGRGEAEKTITEHVRVLDIEDGIRAGQRAVVMQCSEPKALADAWNRVKVVRRTDAQWETAVALTDKLEACRKGAERELSKGLQAIMVAQREAWAQKADTKFLDSGMNVTITLSGAHKENATLKWALMSRAAAHKLTDGGSMQSGSFLSSLQKIGFKRVTFTDGYDDSWSYTLEPDDEMAGGAKVLEQHGLGTPLKLQG